MATVNLGHVVGPGVPSGGTAGQVLKKASSTNYDAVWTDVGDLPEVGAALADIADEYSSSTVYNEGDYCIYSGQLYKRGSWGADTPAAEDWTAAHWTAVAVMDELDAEASARATANTAINTRISGLQGEIGYVVDGKQCANAVATGKYVIVRNSTITGVTDGLYTAAKAITANTDIDSTYLTAVSSGGVANSLYDSIANLIYTKNFLTREVNVTANTKVRVQFDVTQQGYTPIGITETYIELDSSSVVYLHDAFISSNTAYIDFTSNTSKNGSTVQIRVIYVKQ